MSNIRQWVLDIEELNSTKIEFAIMSDPTCSILKMVRSCIFSNRFADLKRNFMRSSGVPEKKIESSNQYLMESSSLILMPEFGIPIAAVPS